MTLRTKVGFCCLGLVSAGTVAVGVLYLCTPEFMPHHAAAIGRNWSELDPALQLLVLSLLKGGGGAATAAGLSMAILLLIPFRRGDAWSRWAILLIGLTGYLPLLHVTLSLQRQTPATPPWYGVVAALVLLVAGFSLSSRPGRPVTRQRS